MSINLGSAFGIIRLSAAGVRTGVANALGHMDRLQAGMDKAGKALTTKVTLPLVGIGVAAAKSAIDMEAAMRNIQSVSKQTDTQIADLSDRFLDMSVDLGQTTDSALGLAEAYYEIQGSGFEGADAMVVLEASTKAASAGLTDTQVAAGAVAAKINAYGESADEAAWTSDLMFRTVDRGVGTFEELSGSLASVVGSAANAGVSFDVVSAALSTMSKQGISFAEGGVALNQLILRLIDPGEDLAEVLQDLGYQSGQAALEQLGLVGTLEALAGAGYDNTAALAPLLGNVRALRAALALTGEGAEMFSADLVAMADASGATEDAFAIQSMSVSAQMKNLRNELSALAIDFGNELLPAIRDVVAVAKDLLAQFRALPEETQQNIVKVGLLAAAIGPLLLVGAKLIGALTTIVGATQAVVGGIQAAAAAAPALVTALGTVTVAATATVASVVGVGLAARGLAQRFEEGADDTRGAINVWSAESRRLVSEGHSINEVFSELASRTDEATEAMHANGGIFTDVAAGMVRAISSGEIYSEIQREVNDTAVQSTESYAEYRTAIEAYNESLVDSEQRIEAVTQAQYREIEARLQNRSVLFDLAGVVGGVKDSMMDYVQVETEAQAQAEALAQAEAEAAEALAETAGASLEAKEALSVVGAALGDSSMHAGSAEAAMRSLAVRMGEIDQGAVKLEEDLDLVGRAFGEGVIDLGELNDYLQQATEGTLELSIAERKVLNESISAASAQRELSTALQAQFDATRQASNIMSVASSALSDTALSASQVNTVMDGMAVMLGETSQRAQDLERDVALVSAAFGEGVIDVQSYQQYLYQARDGTLELSTAQRQAIVTATEHAKAVRDLKAATEENVAAQLTQMETLSKADAQGVARVALKELEGAYDSGALSFEDYMTATMEVQDQFGLVDDRGRALQQGLTALTTTLTAGVLPVDQYDDALAALIEDADDGIVKFDELLGGVLAVNDAVEEFEPGTVFDAATGQFVSNATQLGQVGGMGSVYDAATGQYVQPQTPALPPEIIEQLRALGIGAPTPEASTGSGMREFDAMLGQFVSTMQQSAPTIVIYGGLSVEGVQDTMSLLAQLQEQAV